MKKIIIATTLLAIILGCSKESTSGKVAKLEAALDVKEISSDVLDCFDITYTYTDFNGVPGSKAITGTGITSFTLSNPGLGEDASCPFTARLTFTPKSRTDKGGEYDGTISYKLEVNAYYSNGSLVTDSSRSTGRGVIGYSNNLPAKDLQTLQARAGEYSFKECTYKTFYCKTLSGEWHIGVEKQ